MHFGFLENSLQRGLDKAFFLRRASRAIKEDVRECTGPQKRRYLRQ